MDIVLGMAALNLMGTPYVWGALSRTQSGGVNCIGLIYTARSMCGQYCPETAAELATFGTPVDNPEIGDLIVIQASQKWADQGRPWHFGIYVGEGRMVHASSKRGVEIRHMPVNKPYYFQRLPVHVYR